MSYSLFVTPTARRQLKKLPGSAQKAIRIKLVALCASPFSSGLDVKKLQGREGYRLRVGDFRVLYRLDNKRLVVEVLEAGHRKEIY